MKQQGPRKDQDYSSYSDNSQYRENSGWTEIIPDTRFDNDPEEWDVDSPVNVVNTVDNFSDNLNTDTSWGGLPASEDWDLDINKQTTTRCSVTPLVDSRPPREPSPIGSEIKSGKKNLFGPSSSSTNVIPTSDSSWGASLTGSAWESGTANIKQWDVNVNRVDKESKEPVNDLDIIDSGTQSNNVKTIPNAVNTSNPSLNASQWNKSANKPITVESSLTSASPGITPWAGLDSFDAGPSQVESHPHHPLASPNNFYPGGAKPKITPVSSFHSYHSDTSDKPIAKVQQTPKENTDSNFNRNEKRLTVSSLDNKIDSNLKVTGWLQNSTPSEDWDEDDKQQHNDEEFGWTTVSLKTKVSVLYVPIYECNPGQNLMDKPQN